MSFEANVTISLVLAFITKVILDRLAETDNDPVDAVIDVLLRDHKDVLLEAVKEILFDAYPTMLLVG
jgi:hypothetical protein